MGRYFFTFSLLFVLSACSSETVTHEEEIVETSQTTAVPNQIFTAEVQGMMCVKGCGSAIRKELYATDAVGDISFEIDSESENYITTVEFDKQLISKEEIEKIISATNKNQFTIVWSKTAEIKTTSSSGGKDKSESNQTNSIESSYDDLSVPNLFDIFTRFFLK